MRPTLRTNPDYLPLSQQFEQPYGVRVSRPAGRNVSNPGSRRSAWYSIHTLLVSARGSSFPEKAMPRVALVVDDSMLIRHTVCRFLEERGYTVESATNGEEALPIVKRIHPDIIITD